LYSHDGKDTDCVIIIISVANKIAEIHGISNEILCLVDTNVSNDTKVLANIQKRLPSFFMSTDTNTNIGSHLLKITLKIIKKYANKLGINKIILKDNSLKQCGNNKIKLANMLILLTGHTWYGKYGFRPADNTTNTIDKFLNKKYDANIKIINNMTITHANLLKYIKMTKKASLIIQTKNILKQNPNMLLKDFLNKFLEKYDKTCKYFYMFYEQLFYDLNLTKLQNESFIKILYD
jgi:hypothetical protein